MNQKLKNFIRISIGVLIIVLGTPYIFNGFNTSFGGIETWYNSNWGAQLMASMILGSPIMAGLGLIITHKKAGSR